MRCSLMTFPGLTHADREVGRREEGGTLSSSLATCVRAACVMNDSLGRRVFCGGREAQHRAKTSERDRYG